MSKATWADVKKGDVVEIGGRHWHVSKIKAKGKRARVTMDAAKIGERTGDVALADRVKIAPSGVDFAKLLKKQRAEQAAAGRWTAPSDDAPSVPPEIAQRNVEKILGARLMGETKDGQRWYVPPVDVSTIAMHLRIFHGVEKIDTEHDALLETHAKAHEAAERGELFLHVDHTHSAVKP
jgi:hypothetical protein